MSLLGQHGGGAGEVLAKIMRQQRTTTDIRSHCSALQVKVVSLDQDLSSQCGGQSRAKFSLYPSVLRCRALLDALAESHLRPVVFCMSSGERTRKVRTPVPSRRPRSRYVCGGMFKLTCVVTKPSQRATSHGLLANLGLPGEQFHVVSGTFTPKLFLSLTIL